MGQLMPLKLMAVLLINQLVPPTISGAWGVAIVGNFIFPPLRGTPGLPQGAPHHQILSGRMPICGNPVFSSNHMASLASWASLPINYFWEDAHLWKMLPPAISPSGYPSWPPTTHPLSILFIYLYLYIANIFNL